MSPSRRFVSLILPGLAALLVSASALQAQVVVYKMRFEPVRSVNLDFYNEGYFVAPATGGAGSFIFMVNQKGEKLYSPTASGRLFPALTKDKQRRWIVSGGAGGTTAGTSGAGYVCFGAATQSVRFVGPTFDIRTKIAPSLRGAVTAYSDESSLTTEAATEDGTISFAAVLDFRMSYEKDRTSEANKNGQSVAQVITALIAELQRRGFDPEVSTTP